MTDPEQVIVQIDAKMWDAMQVAQRKTVRSLMRLVVVVLVVQFAFVAFLGWRSYLSQQRQECVARIEGKAFGLAFSALAAPPAPNPARGVAVEKGLVQAARLQDLAHYC